MMTAGLAALVAVAAAAGFALWQRRRGHAIQNTALKVGTELATFSAETEDGRTVGPESLRGKPAVIVFLRGSWCPFCTAQVKGLMDQYRRINERGAALVFITVRPLDTTSRVAEIFGVDFTFWLDPGLQVARQLGIVLPDGVPADIRATFGQDTIWPTTVVLDANGIIRYAQQSADVRARPDPGVFVRELDKIAPESSRE